MQWDPPADSNPSDIDQYIVNVTSQNILADTVFSAIHVLRVPECDDDIRIQVAAVNHFGCEGPNVEVQPSLLDIPTAPSENKTASATVQGGSASTSSRY